MFQTTLKFVVDKCKIFNNSTFYVLDFVLPLSTIHMNQIIQGLHHTQA